MLVVLCALAAGCAGKSEQRASDEQEAVNRQVTGNAGEAKNGQGASSARKARSAQQAKTAAREALQAKLAPYIGECLNELSEQATKAAREYYEWVNIKTGPTGKEWPILGARKLKYVKSCVDGVSKAAKAPPHLADLEQAGAAYVTALTQLAPLLEEAAQYYEQKDYKDDGMAKGKELHPKLVAAFAAFRKADKQLNVVVDRYQRKLDETALAEIERREGRKLAWHVRRVILRAKALVELTAWPDKLDQDAFGAALDKYDEATAGLAKYVKDDVNYEHEVYVARDLLKAGKAQLRRARNKVRYTAHEKSNFKDFPHMVEGSPPQVIKTYNAMVEIYNQL